MPKLRIGLGTGTVLLENHLDNHQISVANKFHAIPVIGNRGTKFLIKMDGYVSNIIILANNSYVPNSRKTGEPWKSKKKRHIYAGTSYCAHPMGPYGCPAAEIYLTQLLWLQSDEEKFLSVACRGGQYFSDFQRHVQNYLERNAREYT